MKTLLGLLLISVLVVLFLKVTSIFMIIMKFAIAGVCLYVAYVVIVLLMAKSKE